MFIGGDIWIDQNKWNRLLYLQSDSLFIRELSKVIWGDEVLIAKSVTGSASNRLSKMESQVKPALTPEKKNVCKRKYNLLLNTQKQSIKAYPYMENVWSIYFDAF